MKNSVKLGLVGGAAAVVGAAVGYVAARVVDVIQFKRLAKAGLIDDDACECDCCCGGCEETVDAPVAEAVDEAAATDEAVVE